MEGTIQTVEIAHDLFLRVNRLLDLWVHGDHSMVEIRVLPHENLGIPCHGNKDGVNATAQRSGEDVACRELVRVFMSFADNLQICRPIKKAKATTTGV